MEFVVTQVQRRVDGLEWLEINVDLSLFSFRGNDFTTVDDQPVRGNLVVEFETLLGGCDSREDGKAIDSGFDVGCSTLEISADDMTSGASYNAQILPPTFLLLGRLGPLGL